MHVKSRQHWSPRILMRPWNTQGGVTTGAASSTCSHARTAPSMRRKTSQRCAQTTTTGVGVWRGNRANENTGTRKMHKNPVSSSWLSQPVVALRQPNPSAFKPQRSSTIAHPCTRAHAPKLYHVCPTFTKEWYNTHNAAMIGTLARPDSATNPAKTTPAHATPRSMASLQPNHQNRVGTLRYSCTLAGILPNADVQVVSGLSKSWLPMTRAMKLQAGSNPRLPSRASFCSNATANAVTGKASATATQPARQRVAGTENGIDVQ